MRHWFQLSICFRGAWFWRILIFCLLSFFWDEVFFGIQFRWIMISIIISQMIIILGKFVVIMLICMLVFQFGNRIRVLVKLFKTSWGLLFVLMKLLLKRGLPDCNEEFLDEVALQGTVPTFKIFEFGDIWHGVFEGCGLSEVQVILYRVWATCPDSISFYAKAR